MQAVASFREGVSLETDKKVNLVYGLNGTGKSTIAHFLYDPTAPEFSSCYKVPADSEQVLVYSQRFIQDTFYEADSLKGIFSLSKQNKAAEEKITSARRQIAKLERELQAKVQDKTKLEDSFASQNQSAINEIWKIKTRFTGGDRVLEYCLEGLKGRKEKLFAHVFETPKPKQEPAKSPDALRKEVAALKADDAIPQAELPKLVFSAAGLEEDSVFQKPIAGSGDSVVAPLIEKLGNSDWVLQGLAFIPDHVDENGAPCPFCQSSTVTAEFIDRIKGYFDESFQKDIARLEELHAKYAAAIDSIGKVDIYTEHPFAVEKKSRILELYLSCRNTAGRNLRTIGEKLANPHTPKHLEAVSGCFTAFNTEVASINETIREFNKRLKERAQVLAELKGEFWARMRWDYDQTISRYSLDLANFEKQLGRIVGEIKSITNQIASQRSVISAAQKETVNTDEAVDAINAGLLELGIDDIRVIKHSDRLYRVARSGESEDAFRTLSEGEKMLISFLYFCELCKGRLTAEDTESSRIAVIDDPISSMSHIFVFNVGQLIRSLFFYSDRISQVFVLTHNLYFFYELADPNHAKRAENQKLFRLYKSSSQSKILVMKYDEIQNDYQAYWSIVNDPDQPAALIANCMRNIVEYFFGFVRKRDLNNVFQLPELRANRFQAFCRFVNRESHSFSQNVLDTGEFDYDDFREGLRLVFAETGYEEHYSEMSKC